MPESKLQGSERYLPLVPAFVLLMVALFHAYNAHVHNLSPWKGGGFGMFSTVDGPASRFFRVFLQNEVGGRLVETPVRLPSDRTAIGRLAMSARTMPNARDTRALAYALTEVPWLTFSQEGQEGKTTIAPEGARGMQGAKGTPAAFTAVRLEIRRVKLSTRDWSISSEVLAEVGAPR